VSRAGPRPDVADGLIESSGQTPMSGCPAAEALSRPGRTPDDIRGNVVGALLTGPSRETARRWGARYTAAGKIFWAEQSLPQPAPAGGSPA
jgi:hypothetical protein